MFSYTIGFPDGNFPFGCHINKEGAEMLLPEG